MLEEIETKFPLLKNLLPPLNKLPFPNIPEEELMIISPLVRLVLYIEESNTVEELTFSILHHPAKLLSKSTKE